MKWREEQGSQTELIVMLVIAVLLHRYSKLGQLETRQDLVNVLVVGSEDEDAV